MGLLLGLPFVLSGLAGNLPVFAQAFGEYLSILLLHTRNLEKKRSVKNQLVIQDANPAIKCGYIEYQELSGMRLENILIEICYY